MDAAKEATKGLVIHTARSLEYVTDKAAYFALKTLLWLHGNEFEHFNSHSLSRSRVGTSSSDLTTYQIQNYREQRSLSMARLSRMASMTSIAEDIGLDLDFEEKEIDAEMTAGLDMELLEKKMRELSFEFHNPNKLKGRETGLLEDIENFSLSCIDFVFNGMKTAWNFNYLKRPITELKSEIRALVPNEKIVDLDKVNLFNGVKDLAESYGYLYDAYDVVTEDGYILKLERIRASEAISRRTIFFQHGIMDSSFTWCCNGVDSSLAFLCANEGYDVFLGNFRGAYGRRDHIDPQVSADDSKFFNFSIDEHGFFDLCAMIAHVRQIKNIEFKIQSTSQETREFKDYYLVACAHSLGGAAFLMHTVYQKMNKINHGLDAMILVSPAGILKSLPTFTLIGAKVVGQTLVRWSNRFSFSDERITKLVVKMVHDLKQSFPNGELLISLVILILLGGNEKNPKHGPFSTVDQVAHNLLVSGTSSKVFVHLRQHIQSGKFLSYDKRKTASYRHFTDYKVESEEVPIEFPEHYNLIDIPVKLIAGDKDRLISKTDVLEHFEKMRVGGVDVEMEVIQGCGHADFTCGFSARALNGVLSQIRRTFSDLS